MWLVLGYLLVGGLWIISSDYLLALLTDDAGILHLWQTYKGLLYVAVTGGLLFLLLHRVLPDGRSEFTEVRGSVWAPYTIFFSLALAVMLIALIAFAGLRATVLDEKHGDLEQILALKVEQVVAWRQERHADLLNLARHSSFAQDYLRWLDDEAGESGSARGERLGDRLRGLVDTGEYRAALVFDAGGGVRLAVGEASTVGEQAEALIAKVRQRGEWMEAALYREEDGPGEASIRYDIAAPLFHPDEPGELLGVVMLRLVPEQTLYAMVSRWPLAEGSSESFLVRHENGSVAFLSPLRHLPEQEPLTLRMAYGDTDLDEDFKLEDHRGLFAARDYRGAEVLAAAAPIPGTDWHLVTQIERAEAFAALDRFLWLELLITVLLMAAAAGATILWIGRQNARHQVRFYREESSRRAAERQVEYLAHHDRLTGLPNHELLAGRVGRAVALAERGHHGLALLFIDLDRFKVINESLGHARGDELLNELGLRIQQCVCESDTVSRQGGDEFVVLLPEVDDRQAASRMAEAILKQLGRPVRVAEHELRVAASIGIALYPDGGTDYGELLRNAETAMYAAKEAGRDRYLFYTPELNRYATERLELERDLRHALEEGQLSIHYQPQADLASGRIIGVEALLRWDHPRKGMIPPDFFIPLAEENGLIVDIGEWVLREACRAARDWQEQGFQELPVAVNLSAVQFRRDDLYQSVERALGDSGLEGRYLELELTERLLIADTGQVIETLRRLKRLGVMISIDDFGTGYSSLGYLTRFPLDKLKVDRSFVSQVHREPERRAIVTAIIQMAHSLGLKAIAEGVEEEAEMAFLRTAGCDEVQGFWLSHPLPLDALLDFLLYRDG